MHECPKAANFGQVNMPRNNINKSGGFTLVKVLITVVIIGILAAVSIPLYSAYPAHAKAAKAITHLRALSQYGQSYIQAYPADWSKSGKLLGANVSGTPTQGDGNWVEEIIATTNIYLIMTIRQVTPNQGPGGKLLLSTPLLSLTATTIS